MTKTFTENDLVKFLYREVDEDTQLDIKEFLRGYTKSQIKLEELEAGKSALDTFEIEAPREVVSRILHASKSFQAT